MQLRPLLRSLLPGCLLAASLAGPACGAPAENLRFSCRGWAPIYLGSWAPVNPDTTDMDPLTIDVNENTRMTSFVLTMIGRTNFATKISESHVKGAIAYRQLMVDDMIEFIDFSLNRGTGEVVITALEKSRRAHLLYQGRCQKVKTPF